MKREGAKAQRREGDEAKEMFDLFSIPSRLRAFAVQSSCIAPRAE